MCVPGTQTSHGVVIVNSTIVVTTNNYKHVDGQPAHAPSSKTYLFKTMHAHAYALSFYVAGIVGGSLVGKQRQ